MTSAPEASNASVTTPPRGVVDVRSGDEQDRGIGEPPGQEDLRELRGELLGDIESTGQLGVALGRFGHLGLGALEVLLGGVQHEVLHHR